MTGISPLTDTDRHQLPKNRAYNHIRDQIITGAWPGGTRLQPEQIARELGISRMPVRDAIAQLDGEGLVTIRPHQSAVVTLLPPQEIVELYEIRAILEGHSARKAAEKVTDSDLDELRLLNGRLVRSELDVPRWLAYHDQFHDFVCEIGKQRHLLQEIRRIRSVIQPYLLMFIHEYRQGEMVGDEHKLLIDALASRNGTLAERTFIHHITSAGEGAEKFLTLKQRHPVAGQQKNPARAKPAE